MFSKPKPKQPSGCQNRKRKAIAEKNTKASAKLLCSFLNNPTSSFNNTDEHFGGEQSTLEPDKESQAELGGEGSNSPFELQENQTSREPIDSSFSEEEKGEEIDTPKDHIEPTLSDSDSDKSQEKSDICDATELNSYLTDLGTWPDHISASLRDLIITKGPISPELESYPRDETKRSFSNLFYYRLANNGQKVKRRWLTYSKKKNSVFCFCCKIFNTSGTTTLLEKNGNSDWRHIGKTLTTHDTAPNHMKCYEKWIEAEKSLSEGTTMAIDHLHQQIVAQEKERWKNVLTRLLAITQFLAQHQLAFRGTHETLYKLDNGNYLGLVELIAKFDPVMKEHISRVLMNEKRRCVSYLGKTIQNELLSLMGNKVRECILNRVKEAKYFALILDCTPDLSRKEQLSIILRYVHEKSDKTVEICESFVDFVEITDTTGKGMSETVFKALENYGLDIQNCRGQGYDNGANMKGKHSGLQKRIIDQNKRAFFVPCGCHSLNLVVSDAAKSSVPTVTLFGTIQRLYTLFSSSTKRWSLFLESLSRSEESLSGPPLALKELCITRWEARIDSLKAVRYQIVEVRQALWDLYDDSSFEDDVRSEANSLASTLEDYGFLVSLITWYDVLFQINLASKMLQSKVINFPQAVDALKSISEFLVDFRENGFVSSLVKAKELAEELNVEAKFKTPRLRRKKKHFDYEGRDEPLNDPQEQFKIEFFLPLVDTANSAVEGRFEQLKAKTSKFDFLFKLDKLPDRNTLLIKCKELEELMSDGTDQSDIRGAELCDELVSIQKLLPKEG